MALVIDSPLDLLALHIALFEARYSMAPEREEVHGSTILAGLHSRVYDALETSAKDGDNWKSMRRLTSGSLLYERIRSIIARPGSWSTDASAQEEYLRVLIAPYHAEDAVIQELIAYGNAAYGRVEDPRSDNPT